MTVDPTTPDASVTVDPTTPDASVTVDPIDPDAPLDPTAQAVGVGPHPRPWPDDQRLDPALLAVGDRRNVIDAYHYWKVEAIVADLDRRRSPLQVAIQNWEHDFNIGSIVRTANAFNVSALHILGRRRWNRRGAMVTDRYLHLQHHASVGQLVEALGPTPLIGVDNVPGALRIEGVTLPRSCCLLFGSEGPGLTDEALAACDHVVAISQHGSTRSLNAGAAAAIAMYHWSLRHGPNHAADPPICGPDRVKDRPV